MLITVYCVRRDLSEVTFSLEVDPDFELENFRALCELESGIPSDQALILYAERPLTDNQRSLSSYGLKDGDVVILRQKEASEARPVAPVPVGLPRIDFSSISVPGTSSQPPDPQPPRPPAPDSTTFPQGLDNPSLLREMLLANPHELSLLKERNPPLAEALLSGDLDRFTRVLLEQQQERARREQERIRLISADPFDLEAQAKIEEDIRQQNIEENMTIAMEEAPESFGQVVMLYINCKVNGYPVKAFVDSGAQMTIMSQACAERCHIMRLVDRRWAGIAKGVGTQKIIGRVHLAQVQIEGDFLPCSFSILEEQPMDMLLGLDMLKRHQCSIDLEKNVLVIGTTGTRTSFLPEAELPECARLAYGPGREDMREDMRPEEIADRELAEVLQKSADEADKETTSVDRPSLVPPIDGHHHPVHAPGVTSATPAHSASSQTSVCPPPSAESRESAIDMSAVDAACGGDRASQTGHPPRPFRLSNSAESSSSQLSGGEEDRGPTGAFHDKLAGDSVADRRHRVPATPNSQFQAFVEDLNAELLHAGHSPQPALLEDTMDVDAQTPLAVPAAEPCEPYGADKGPSLPTENSNNQTASSHLPEAAGSEVVDPDTPKPPNVPELDTDESCFSLAAALKELHKLLVVSGQGPARTAAEPLPTGHPGSYQDGLLEDRPSQRNVNGERDTNQTTNSAENSIQVENNLCNSNISDASESLAVQCEPPVSSLSSADVQWEPPVSSLSSINMEHEPPVSSLPSADVQWEPPVSSQPSINMEHEPPVSSLPSADVQWEPPVSSQPSINMEHEPPVSSLPSADVQWEPPVSSQPSINMEHEPPVSSLSSINMQCEPPVSSLSSADVQWEPPVSSQPSIIMEHEPPVSSLSSADVQRDPAVPSLSSANVQREPPVSSVQREPPVSSVQREPPVSSVQREPPVSSVQREPPVSSVQREPSPVSTLPSTEVLPLNPGVATDVNGNPIQTSPGDEGTAGSGGDPEGSVSEEISLPPPAASPASPPSAIERIVQAGFPLHDALVALERADGDAELALLALLAKNIVVPS